MNREVENVLAALDGFRMCDQMDYAAYSQLHDMISVLDVPGWISVKDRLPEEDVDVLVSNGLGIEVAAYTTNPARRWYGMSGDTAYAQYWMPLPEPPKEGEA